MNMRDLTKSEIEEYLRFAKADSKAADFSPEQVGIICEAMRAAGLFESIMKKIATAPDDLDALDITYSVLIAMFQMGRECESRLINAALQGKISRPVHDRLRHGQHKP